MYLALVHAFFGADHPDSVAAVFRQYPRVPAAAYAELANYWLERLQPGKAEPWIRHMVMSYNQQRHARVHQKPKYLSTPEWEKGNRVLQAFIRATEARFLRQSKRIEEAIQRFQEAWSLYQEDAPVELLEQLVEAYRVVGQHKNAYSVCVQAIVHSQSSDTLWTQFRELFLQVVQNDSAALQDEMFRLQEQAAQQRRHRLQMELLEWEIPSTVLDAVIATPHGDTISLRRLQGKVVLVDFWATWCRPCIEAFPYLQKLWELYRERSDVAFVVLNVWERTDERYKHVRDFLQNNPQYTFPVYVDERDILPVGLGIPAIPTQLLIDRRGRIQFRKVGYSSVAAYFRELQDCVEVLLRQP
ncbi:MAG: TlpA disulfide reductase family protein [Bacteroidota bacterium]|nr:TlpA disulfide reductase family protein [Bacteroidota bacterium]